MEPVILKDDYYVSEDRIVFTQQQLHIPGLEMFGHHTIKSAISPIQTHYHPNCFELTFVMKGTLTFSVGGTDYKLKGGDIFLTFPDEVHSTNLNPVSISELLWFQIDISNPDFLFFLDVPSSKQLAKQLKHLKNRIFHMNSTMMTLIQDAFHHARQYHTPQLVASYLVLLLQLLGNDSTTSDACLSTDILLSIDYISVHLTEQIELNRLADLCGLSVSAYKQKFKQQMGITPRNYINMQKIERAKQLLDSGCSITDTAMTLGFNTSNYFTTVFKKYTFQSPTDYIHRNL